jgi:6-phosphofructokinase
MKIGVLTGGGDCPGLNAVIRAVARRAWASGHEVIGVREGWRGMVDQRFQPLGPEQISGILPRGGTIIGTTRTNPYKVEGGIDGVKRSFEQLDALVAIGGEDTLGVAARIYKEFAAPVVGVPKTIDNDLNGTDYTFGFDTAVAICTEAIDRLHTTAESHNRVMVVEVMGRHTGWIAVMSGIAGGADMILIPERPIDFDEVETEIRRRHARQELLDRRRQRGLRAARRRGQGRGRPVRPQAAGQARRRRAARRRDRGAHRLRDARHRARPRQRGGSPTAATASSRRASA